MPVAIISPTNPSQKKLVEFGVDALVSNNNNHNNDDGANDKKKSDEAQAKVKSNDSLERCRAGRICDILPEELRTASKSPSQQRYITSSTSFLRPGLNFTGTQQSGRAIYDVSVSILHVDLGSSTLSGLLKIAGLSEENPSLTTYFEGEIIGDRYSFYTRRAEWGASEKVDIEHWARFPPFRPLARAVKRHERLRDVYGPNVGNAVCPEAGDADFVFMRWKEQHILPDAPIHDGMINSSTNTDSSTTRHEGRTRILDGVSYAGFYYICLDTRTGNIMGMYFHANSELYQQLSLSCIEGGRRFTGKYEFR